MIQPLPFLCTSGETPILSATFCTAAPCRSVLGGTSGALLVLIVPGLVAASGAHSNGDSAPLQRAAGCLLLLVGAVVLAATVLRLALFPTPA